MISVNNVTTSISVEPFSHTVSGSNRFLVVAVTLDSLESITTIAYHGIPMTQLFQQREGLSTVQALYYLVSPDDGTHLIDIGFSGGVTIFGITAISFNGVDALVPIGGSSFAKDTGVTDNISTTVTVTGTSGMIVSCFGSTRCTGGNAGAGQIEQSYLTGLWGGGVEHFHEVSTIQHTGSDVTVSEENLSDLAATSRKIIEAVELLPTTSTGVGYMMII